MNATVHVLDTYLNGELGRPLATTFVMNVRDAAYHTVHRYKGGPHALATRMPPRVNARGALVPMSGSTLQHKVNPNNVTHGLFIEEARDVMALSDDYSILHAFAAELGHVALRVDVDCEGVTAEMIMRMTKEFGDVLAEVGAATSRRSTRGEKVTHNELRRVEKQAVELIAAVNCLVAGLRSQAPQEA